jgi:two-component system, LuxR family, sensor kinase FixL
VDEARIRERMARAAVSRAADALAHELHQPLGAILRNAEAASLILATQNPDLAELRAIIQDIRSDHKRAAALIEQVRHLVQTHGIDSSADDFAERLQIILSSSQSRGVA